MDFDKAIELILSFEGGYSVDPFDPGGETNFGISKRSYPDLDIKNLTVDQAKQIYLNDYWIKNEVYKLPSMLRLSYFDCCVNQGPGNAKKFLLSCTHGEALDDVDQLVILKEFTFARFTAYSSNFNFSRYGIGWTKRLLHTVFNS